MTRLTSTCSICAGSTRTERIRGIQLEPELDPVADEAGKHVREPFDQAIELDGTGLQQLLAAEGEQLSGEPGRAVGRTVDLLGVLMLDASGRDAVEQQVRVAADRRQQIVEIVRDATGKAADTLEALRLPEIALELLALGHVAKDGDVPAGQNVRPGRELGLAHGAVGPDDVVRASHGALLEQGAPRRPGLFGRSAHRTDSHADELVVAAAEYLAGRWVHVDVSALVVRDDHRLERAVEDGAEQVLALLALGDVDEEPLFEQRLAVCIAHRAHRVEYPAHRAVGANDAIFELERATMLSRCALTARYQLQVVGVDRANPELGLLEPLRGRVAVQLLDLRAHVGGLHRRLDGVYVRDERQLLDQTPVLLLDPPLIADVDDDAAVANLALQLDREVRQQVRGSLARALEADLLLDKWLACRVHAFEERRHFRGDSGGKLCKRAPEMVLRSGTVHLGQRIIDAQIAAIAVGNAHARRRVAEEGFGLRPLGGELALELLLAGHVGQMAVHVELAVVVTVDDTDVPDPNLAAVPSRDPVLDRHLLVGLAHLGERREEARKILRCHAPLPEVRRLAELVQVEAEQRLHLRADEDGPRRRLEPDHVGHDRQTVDDYSCAAFFEGRRHASTLARASPGGHTEKRWFGCHPKRGFPPTTRRSGIRSAHGRGSRALAD